MFFVSMKAAILTSLVETGPAVPGSMVNPVITGNTQVGQTLSCSTGTWSNTPTSYAYQWRRNGGNISGATNATYALVGADTGADINCTVVATNALGPSGAAGSNTLTIDSVAVNIIAPFVSGTAEVGFTLSCGTGVWTYSPTSYTYQWKRDGTNIGGATANTYLLVTADAGTAITCAVTATNPQGVSSPAISNTRTVAGLVPVNTIAPAVTGSTTVGAMLHCSAGTWTYSPTSYAYQWLRSGSVISGATTGMYTTTTPDIGQNISCRVTASNAAGASSPAGSNSLLIVAVDEGLTAPTLTWESTPEVNPPLLVVGLPDDTEAGDHIVCEISADGDDPWTEYFDVVVDDPDGEEQDETAAELDDGDWVLRARMERGAEVSDWSVEVNITINSDLAATITTPATASCVENIQLSISLTADEAVTWSLTGGADVSKFEISGTTLRWTSNGTKNFEAPDDADTNNTYVVQVTATDATSNVTNKTITVTVTDASDSATTLNPADKGNVTLSGGNLVLTNLGDTMAAARSIASASSGKKYWEITITTAIAPNLLSQGMYTGAAGLSPPTYPGVDRNSVGWTATGDIYSLVLLNIHPVATYTTGDVLGFAVDLDAMLLWVRVNNGNWNNNGSANPATGTGGGDISGMNPGPYFGTAVGRLTGDTITANFGATAYANAAPAGFGNL